jgi:hypothetical protein
VRRHREAAAMSRLMQLNVEDSEHSLWADDYGQSSGSGVMDKVSVLEAAADQLDKYKLVTETLITRCQRLQRDNDILTRPQREAQQTGQKRAKRRDRRGTTGEEEAGKRGHDVQLQGEDDAMRRAKLQRLGSGALSTLTALDRRFALFSNAFLQFDVAMMLIECETGGVLDCNWKLTKLCQQRKRHTTQDHNIAFHSLPH